MATNPLHDSDRAIRQLAKKWRGPALQRPLWAIIDWPVHFENSHTRKLARLPFVLVPTKHDGKSFNRLMRNASIPRKGDIFACWILLLELAAKTPARGYLADEDGPYTPLDMEVMSGMPSEAFTLALDFLASEEIRWLEKTTADSLPSSPDRSGDSPEYIPHSPKNESKINDLQHSGESPDNLPTTRENVGAREEKRSKEKGREENPPIVPKGTNENEPVTSLTEAAEKKEGAAPGSMAAIIQTVRNICALPWGPRGEARKAAVLGETGMHGLRTIADALPLPDEDWQALRSFFDLRKKMGPPWEEKRFMRREWENAESLAANLLGAVDWAKEAPATSPSASTEKKDAPPGWQAAAAIVGFEATDWNTLPAAAKAAIRRQLAENAA
jgi:hypothetical protein